ncbi:hypothetical protein [Glycomyces paridis]|uniref:Uncharacterized protein n=1 Tax=Glycomyces paridis TaxID=2126555 RepID=A0A4S8PL15_9ACTN|nr:hypothetical protein [Glycomyces paridis]THV28984.1 hypothetical protein E9998_09535 [Glycomyces paridis]
MMMPETLYGWFQVTPRRIALSLLGVTVLALAAVTAVTAGSAPPIERTTGPEPAALLLPTMEPHLDLQLADQQFPPSVEGVPGDDHSCEQVFQGWTTADERLVVLRIRRCASFEWAAYQQALILDDARQLDAEIIPTDDIPFGSQIVVSRPSDEVTQPLVVVVARRGNYVLQSTMMSDQAHLAEDTALALAVAELQWEHLVGAPGPAIHPPVQATLLLRTGWNLAFIFITLYATLNLLGWLRERCRGVRAASGVPAGIPGVRWLDVSERSTRLARRARMRFWTMLVLVGLSQALPLPTAVSAAVLGLLPVVYTLGRRHAPGTNQIWGRHAEPQVRTHRNQGRAGIGVFLSSVTFVLGLVALLVPAILLALSATDEVTANGRWHPVVLADEPFAWRLIPVPLLIIDTLAVALMLLTISGALYRYARRQSLLDTTQKLEADNRAPIIFLRNFSDDEVTIRTSPLTRKSIMDKLGGHQFERFEEILVRYLSTYGPVIAVNNPNSKQAPLGAARESLAHDAWQATVGSRLDSSAMIVVAAAPGAVTKGLSWELEQIADRSALPRTLLVIPPYPSGQLRNRWRRFLEMATKIDIPSGTTDHVDQILVLANRGNSEWDAYHARHRTDWAYAVALAVAAETVDRPVTEVRPSSG